MTGIGGGATGLRALRGLDRASTRHYHRAPMAPPDDRQRILIVEDEPNIASFARMYLEAAGLPGHGRRRAATTGCASRSRIPRIS